MVDISKLTRILYLAEINCILEKIMKVSSLNVLSYLTDTFNWSIKEFIKEFIKEKIIH